MSVMKNIIILLFILAGITANLNRPCLDRNSMCQPDASPFITAEPGMITAPADISRSNIGNNACRSNPVLPGLLIISSYGAPLTIKKTCSNPFAGARSKPVKIPHTLVSLGCKLTI